MNDIFLSLKPAYPWSLSPVGLPALAVVAAVLVVFTIWTYTGHPNATRRRILIVLALRLGALAVALLTALRPSLGVQERPRIPGVLLVGVDTSESMTVKDELDQRRIDAVAKMIEKCQPLFDDLAAEHDLTVVTYKFSTPDFSEGTDRYVPGVPADGNRSDYGTYLNRTFDRWQGERFVRGHLVIGDGGDNGEAFSAVAEAGRWGRRGVPVTTFTVGQEDADTNVRDVIVAGVECDPSPAPIKTRVEVVGTVHAYGFAGARAVARVFVDGKLQKAEEVTLEKEKDNKVRVTINAPPDRGEVKVTMQVGQVKDDQLVALPGESRDDNNASDTYLTVTKDGVRVLIIDRLTTEEMRIRDALRSEKRFDVNEVFRQTDAEPGPAERGLLDLDAQAYDVIVIGNVSPAQLRYRQGGAEVDLVKKIGQKVRENGTGVIFLGGEHALAGDPKNPAAYDDLLPVTVPPKAGNPPLAKVVENLNPATGRPLATFQTVPTDVGLGGVMRLSQDPKETRALWDQLNTANVRPAGGGPGVTARITGYNEMTPQPGRATVFAWASPENAPVPAGTPPAKGADPLLVGWQLGDGKKGRVLAFAAFNTFLWEKLGQPRSRLGTEIHHRFWRQVVLYLAGQEDEEGQAYVRPAFRQLKVGGEQTLRVGVKLPGGGDDPDAEMTVRIVPMPKAPPGQEQPKEPAAADIDKAKAETIVRDATGAKVLFRPRERGEYFVELTAPKKDASGRPVLDAQGRPEVLRATAKFIAVPDISDEMLRVSADHDFMSRLSVPTGGRALRLEDLPAFLKELKEQKEVGVKPKPKFYPDWRRNHSRGFLPLWLAVFAALLAAEWGLRRLWGMV
jgi:hypothetical protein